MIIIIWFCTFTTVREFVLCHGYYCCCCWVAPMSPCTLSGSAVRTMRGGEGLPKMFCLVVSSLGLLRLSSVPLWQEGTVCLWNLWSVTGSNAHKEDRINSIAYGFAILWPGEPVIHILCPRISWWSLVVLATVFALLSASSLPGIALWPGTHRWVIGPV